jgi:hypothetical protein
VGGGRGGGGGTATARPKEETYIQTQVGTAAHRNRFMSARTHWGWHGVVRSARTPSERRGTERDGSTRSGVRSIRSRNGQLQREPPRTRDKITKWSIWPFLIPMYTWQGVAGPRILLDPTPSDIGELSNFETSTEITKWVKKEKHCI